MKRNSKGVSLIVLSITILVMAILAATAIIALEDSGIIGRSKNTVKNNNYSDEYTRLVVIKNGILTDNLGTITVDEYITELTNKGLINNVITNGDGTKTVTTTSGFDVIIGQNTESDLNITIDGYTPPVSNNGGGNGNVPTPTPTPTIVLNKTTISKTINSGSTATETVTATTQNISGSLTWTSSNTSVATVTGSGNTATITIKAGGTAVITAKNGSTTASCTVVVTENEVLTPQQISGTWVFNDKLKPILENADEPQQISQDVNFTSNGEQYTNMSITGMTVASLAYDYSHIYIESWDNISYKTVNFGSTSQTVSAEFYKWFTANATRG